MSSWVNFVILSALLRESCGAAECVGSASCAQEDTTSLLQVNQMVKQGGDRISELEQPHPSKDAKRAFDLNKNKAAKAVEDDIQHKERFAEDQYNQRKDADEEAHEDLVQNEEDYDNKVKAAGGKMSEAVRNHNRAAADAAEKVAEAEKDYLKTKSKKQEVESAAVYGRKAGEEEGMLNAHEADVRAQEAHEEAARAELHAKEMDAAAQKAHDEEEEAQQATDKRIDEDRAAVERSTKQADDAANAATNAADDFADHVTHSDGKSMKQALNTAHNYDDAKEKDISRIDDVVHGAWPKYWH